MEKYRRAQQNCSRKYDETCSWDKMLTYSHP
jgi:hypothetical protein